MVVICDMFKMFCRLAWCLCKESEALSSLGRKAGWDGANLSVWDR